ncbi:hypothetical protein [Actinomadura sp. 3N508]|uniref:hypothetical protein n=1 Tax=Actinomadura sp. 3N508 TaxID=3375153 RepID=UPI00379B186E
MIEVPVPLRPQYRRCAVGLARLSTAIDTGSAAPRPMVVGETAREVLVQAREAARLVLGSLDGTGRKTPATRFLACRLERLAIAADQIREAAAACDPAALNRGVVRFRVLTTAMWKVLFAVYRHPQVAVAADTQRPVEPGLANGTFVPNPRTRT